MMFAHKFSAVTLAGALFIAPYAFCATLQRRSAEYFDPAAGGGSMFVDTGNGLGEPLNVCSHPYFFHLAYLKPTFLDSAGHRLGTQLLWRPERGWLDQLCQSHRIVRCCSQRSTCMHV